MKIGSTDLKLKKMSNICDFDRILKTKCNLQQLKIWMTLNEMMQTCICGEQDF